MAEAAVEKPEDKPGFIPELPEKSSFEPKTLEIGDASSPGGESKPGAAVSTGAAAPGAAGEGAAELQRQLDAETGRRQHAERLAAAERERAIHAERSATAIGSSMIDNSIQAWTNESEQAEAAWEQAMSNGDYRSAAKQQTRLADARNTLMRLGEEKQNIGERARAPRQETRVEPAPARPSNDGRSNADMIAATLVKDNFPKSAAWIKNHPELLSDQKSINKVSGAHGYVADVLGLVPETEAYFAKMEETLGLRQAAPAPQAETVDPGEPDPEPIQRRSSPARPAVRPAAPAVQSSTPNLSGVQRRQSVTLSSEQREAASFMGMTDEEYALDMVKARDAGKLLGVR